MNHIICYGANERWFAKAALYPDFSLARVVSQYKSLYKIVTEFGESLAEVSGKFRYMASALSEYPAVGDFVMVEPSEKSRGNAIIHRVLPRESVFERAAAGGELHVADSNAIAAIARH